MCLKRGWALLELCRHKHMFAHVCACLRMQTREFMSVCSGQIAVTDAALVVRRPPSTKEVKPD